MSIKQHYRLYSRIAIGIAVVASAIITWNLRKTLDANVATIFLGAFSFCTHLLFLIINSKKEKHINKKFGVIKVNGDHWLGYDGFWHDGYNDVYNHKLEQYYQKGGEDLGYLSTPFMNVVSMTFGCLGGLMVMTGKMVEIRQTMEIESVIVLMAFLLYCILRRAVLG